MSKDEKLLATKTILSLLKEMGENEFYGGNYDLSNRIVVLEAAVENLLFHINEQTYDERK
jgi:hypothetical protein